MASSKCEEISGKFIIISLNMEKRIYEASPEGKLPPFIRKLLEILEVRRNELRMSGTNRRSGSIGFGIDSKLLVKRNWRGCSLNIFATGISTAFLASSIGMGSSKCAAKRCISTPTPNSKWGAGNYPITPGCKTSNPNGFCPRFRT